MSRTPRFNDSIEAQHQHVDVDAWDDIYIIGDIHGCLSELETLLNELAPSEDDLVVFVGDLIRKGPNNHGVVDLVRSSPNMLSIRGNNEEKLLRGTKVVDDLTEEDLQWIRGLPVAISWEDTLVVHGGIDPQMDREDHTVDDLQNTRSLVPDGSYDPPFWWDKYEGPERVFFGHTVLEAPVHREYAVGLDTGCVYGGELTAYDWRKGKLVSVGVDRTVQHRKDSKFINPRSVPV
ncbi:metallophosphoesterase family protein [Haladaptatus sp. DFWS20]|uniref:metallophosphoesterase family protein n=1 Tax=Haladaptatus sp. DFWS20 TaxID=3403467 RepID=UPI003EBAEA88